MGAGGSDGMMRLKGTKIASIETKMSRDEYIDQQHSRVVSVFWAIVQYTI